MKKALFISTFILFNYLFQEVQAQSSFRYKDSNLSPEERTLDLLSQMTLEEKVGQLLCPLGWEMYEKQENTVTHSTKFEQLIKERQAGMLWATFRADPWTKKTLENGLNPEWTAKAANALQRYVIENTRLGIPIFLAEEAPHGHMAIGTTVFPTGIGQASTWNPRLMEQMGKVIATEIRLQGAHIAYGPVLDLTRDPRWSRVEESYGEDPVLSGVLGSAIVKGAGGGDLSKKNSVISTLKHFIAYGIPEGGHNGNSALLGLRELHEKFLPPFRAAIDAGALSVMTAYNSVDGVPCTSNRYLLTDILLKQWKFQGFSVSDLVSIEGIKGNHRVTDTDEGAAILAANAGLAVDLGGNAYPYLVEAVRRGAVEESVIDSAAYRVLHLKFAMGLFENPYVDSSQSNKGVRTKENIALAREVARESIVLLKNENGLLPLNKKVKVAVIGPNADNIYNQLGDYTAPQDDASIKTVLEGIREKLNAGQVEYVKGCAIRDTAKMEIEQAVEAAKKSDVVVAVVGGSSARDFKTKYIETGAAVFDDQGISDMESGEGFDRSTLDLLGKQLDLLKALKKTGKPLVVIYIQGRPLNMNWASEQADALLTVWYPGQEGGIAVADVLFGDYNPAGRLPISIPRSVGQLPVYYNRSNPWGHEYVEDISKPLYSFGYGLSYTNFTYRNLQLEALGQYEYRLTFTVENTGKYDGDEVAQLYIRDDFASIVCPVKQLRHFERVHLKKGEVKTVSFTISFDDLSVINQELKQVVELGTFTLMVGPSSDEVRLSSVLTVK
ncbi:beta-glucosidase [termite gut metagenome]|uniref:Beta-glucosidase n=1 Tax=termite gut metagenome TaxID=433724 RepID=A0A5J4T1C3_9ZZZZ